MDFKEVAPGTANRFESGRTRVEHDDVCSAGCEVLDVSDGGLTFGTTKSGLNGREVVELEQRHEMVA